jgi:hypothetical protein
MTSTSTWRQPEEAPVHDADLHLPQAVVGALAALVLLVAAFVSTPASAATIAATPACTAGSHPAR